MVAGAEVKEEEVPVDGRAELLLVKSASWAGSLVGQAVAHPIDCMIQLLKVSKSKV